MEALRQQLAESVSCEEGKLKSCRKRTKQIDNNLGLRRGSGHFGGSRLQQPIDRGPLLLQIEAGDAQLPNEPAARVPRKELLSDLAPALG